ncbi:RNase III inhibitor [Aliifodinibius salipaludis]|uniref:RNase III inhibitor n=1 Tax=Fodinibius salipaludis TaxID=2032627 RepID=A0A2A2GC40_9BACT|nr:macro domain-containing protein [Aliifodinibius salipaludis]PAU94415.1 RNase III inhibitor [Aliifodinibius salipaludis]
MREAKQSGTTIELKRGDIANQPDVDAVVNAANAELRIGGGVAGAIHRAAGPELTEQTRSMAPIEPGEAVISGGHNLPNNYIIHCLGPVYGRDKPEEKLLANCYSNALDLAEDHQIESIAFPAISTGAFGYPMKDAARVAFQTVLEQVGDLEYVSLIRFVLWSEGDIAVHEDVIEEVFG